MPKGAEFLVLSVSIQKAKNGTDYANLQLREPASLGGKIHQAKVWGNVLELKKNEKKDPPLLDGCLLKDVNYKEEEWQGKPQLTLEYYIVVASEEANERMKSFKLAPAVDQSKVFLKLIAWEEKWPLDLKKLFSNISKEFKQKGLLEKFLEVPAGAKNHHARRAGLLQHVEEMVDIAEWLCRPDGPMIKYYGDIIDYPILRASIVLHDIGKVHDYNSELYTWDATIEGEMITHTPYAALLIERNWPTDGSAARKLKLQHCVLAHHGKGIAPVAPLIPEASILHIVDSISATFDIHRTARDPEANIQFNQTLGAKPLVLDTDTYSYKQESN